MDFLKGKMRARGFEPASRLFTIGHYAKLNRRLLVRTSAVYGDNVEFVEDWSIADRFWLCLARHKYLESLEIGVGVKGAKRGYRLKDIARDLNVPFRFADMYKSADHADYLGFMPAEMDCLIAEIEDDELLPDCWDFIAKMHAADDTV